MFVVDAVDLHIKDVAMDTEAEVEAVLVHLGKQTYFILTLFALDVTTIVEIVHLETALVAAILKVRLIYFRPCPIHYLFEFQIEERAGKVKKGSKRCSCKLIEK